jgi:hypothetical protein
MRPGIRSSGRRIFCFRVVATNCNDGRLGGRCHSTRGAIATNFETSHNDVELAIPLDLPLQPVEKVAFKFRDLPTTQARHMDMVSLRTPLIKVLLTLHVHEVELVDKPVTLEQPQRPVHGDAVNLGINPLRPAQQLTGIKMLLGGFYHAQNGSALARHAKPARH